MILGFYKACIDKGETKKSPGTYRFFLVFISLLMGGIRQFVTQ